MKHRSQEARSQKPEARSKGAGALLLASCFWLLASSAFSQTYNHISGDGQSNCTGAGGNALSGAQPFSPPNLGFQYGQQPPTTGSTVTLSNWQLSSSGDEYPVVSIANQLTYMTGLHLVGDYGNCAAGYDYAQLAPGSTQYDSYWLPMFQPTPGAKSTINALGYLYNFLALYNIHGEADFQTLTAAQYETDLVQWRSAQVAAINAGLGASTSPPMLVHQMSAWNICAGSGCWGNSTTPTMLSCTSVACLPGGQGGTGSTPLGQWQVAIDNSPQFIVSPGYQFTFRPDYGPHMDEGGLIGMGSLMGKQLAYWLANPNRVLFTTPRSIGAPSGTSWSIQFWVPVGHLVFDTSTLAESPAGCHGFEFGDNSGAIACPSLPTLSGTGSPDGGNDTANFTLSRACGAGCYIRNAWTGVAGSLPGTANASHGNLRDTDTAKPWCGGQAGAPASTCSGIAAQDLNLYDWAVTFQITNFPYAFNPFSSAPPPPSVTACGGSDSACPNGTAGVAYSESFSITGGAAPVSCSGATGSSGLVINSNCTIAGTPVAGSFTVIVTAKDADNQTGTASFTLEISGGSSGGPADVFGYWGSGPPSGSCTQPSLYFDNTNGNLWFCDGSLVWKETANQ